MKSKWSLFWEEERGGHWLLRDGIRQGFIGDDQQQFANLMMRVANTAEDLSDAADSLRAAGVYGREVFNQAEKLTGRIP